MEKRIKYFYGKGGKIIPRIRLTSANVVFEVGAELGNYMLFEKRN